MFVSMFFFGFVYSTYSKNYRKVSFAMVGAFYISYICIVAFTGFPSENNLSVGVSPSPSPWHILALGALAGSISFGGAYTVIPIILQEAVIRGGWISQKTFLDGVALANVLPAPTVIFSTFVGFIGGKVFSGGDLNGVGGNVGYGFLGGLLMTIGIFAAPFLFAVIGHPYLVKLTENKSLASFFDGITASVVGLIGTTSLEILSAAISPSVTAESMNSINAVIFGMSIYTMYNFKFPNQALILVFVTALSGQFLYKSR
jgi:chromate transport protein ChrA